MRNAPSRCSRRLTGALSFVSLLMLLCALAPLRAEEPQPGTVITLLIGKGDLLRFNDDVQRVAIAEPKVADAVVVSPREVMVNAKGVGKTTLMVWEGAKPAQRYDINVVADNSDLDTFVQELHTAFPGVNVSGNHDTLVLTGSVQNADESKRVQALPLTPRP